MPLLNTGHIYLQSNCVYTNCDATSSSLFELLYTFAFSRMASVPPPAVIMPAGADGDTVPRYLLSGVCRADVDRN